jgi:hypothetical protein
MASYAARRTSLKTMKESSLAHYLSKVWPYQTHVSRIESETSPGFPDVHLTYRGSSSTIELKQTKRPKAKYPFSAKDGLRKSQLDWIEAETQAGGKVLLALGCAREIFFLDASLYAASLAKMLLTDIRRVAEISWVRGNEPHEASFQQVLLDRP